MTRKIIQHQFDESENLTVLCNDGTIWYLDNCTGSTEKWVLIKTPPIPQPDVQGEKNG
tara:strand:- start:558 stop:731 length:174 start_codon:yes stop_codon:yes gene_type:complete